MNGILGMLDISERNQGNPEKLADCRRKIRISSEHLLSLACGCSFLRTADGTMLSVSDWKAEADRKMYEAKKKAHAEMGIREDPSVPRGEQPL